MVHIGARVSFLRQKMFGFNRQIIKIFSLLVLVVMLSGCSAIRSMKESIWPPEQKYIDEQHRQPMYQREFEPKAKIRPYDDIKPLVGYESSPKMGQGYFGGQPYLPQTGNMPTHNQQAPQQDWSAKQQMMLMEMDIDPRSDPSFR